MKISIRDYKQDPEGAIFTRGEVQSIGICYYQKVNGASHLCSLILLPMFICCLITHNIVLVISNAFKGVRPVGLEWVVKRYCCLHAV